MVNKAFHIIITCCLLLSITETSKVMLLVYSTLHGNGCSVLMCTCSDSCSCSGHTSHEKKETEIPLLIPVDNQKKGSCCPTSAENKNVHTQAKICGCGASTNPAGSAFVQALDKVTFSGIQPINLFNNFSDRLFTEANQEKRKPFLNDIFHPPQIHL
jgi:hypothetical protein